MDSNDLERERGITILAKNTAITWGDYRINIVDTPGQRRFRRRSRARARDGRLRAAARRRGRRTHAADAVRDPKKPSSTACGPSSSSTKSIATKRVRAGYWIKTFDLFDRLGATDEQLDFPVVYASALRGFSGLDSTVREGDMQPLFKTIVEHCPPPDVDADGPLQLQVTLLDYSSYVGAIGIGRIKRGTLKRGMAVTVINREGKQRSERITQILGFHGLTRVEVESASAGDIVAFAGIAEPKVSDTLCDPATVEPLPSLTVDEPTISMTFEVNTSPFLGREGKFVTSRQIRERLDREAIHNVALRVEPTADPDKFVVFGRGELHLGVLLENMRREGYEMAVSRPRVVIKQIDGVAMSPTNKSRSMRTPTRRAPSCRRWEAAERNSRTCRRTAAAASVWTTWCRRGA